MIRKYLSIIPELLRRSFDLPVGFKINFFSLKFDGKEEKSYQKEYFEGILIHLRFALIVSLFFYGIFGVLDSFLIPELLNTFLIIRFLVVFPIVILVFLISYLKVFQKIYQPLLSLIIFMAGFGIVLMIYFSKDYPNSLVQNSYYTGLLLVFIFAYNFLKLSFWWATLASWMVVISFEIVLLFLLDLSVENIIIANFFLIAANFMGMFSSYFYELTLRMNFYHKYLLEDEKKKVDRINLQLEDRVYQRTKELEKATEKAMQSDKLKSMFLANISHEIRTPMNGILGFSALLEQEDLSQKKRKSYIEIINNRGEYLMNILNNLIEISMIESGTVNMHNESINLNSTLIKLHKQHSILFKKENFKFITDLPKDDSNTIIKTDPMKLEQIISNLVSNAAKYSKQGEVRLGYRIKKRYLRVFVSDNGPGIPKHFRPYIFNSFAKNENKDEKFIQGTGLGLAISKGLADLMDAKLSYKSTMGEGSSFYLDFDKDVIV